MKHENDCYTPPAESGDIESLRALSERAPAGPWVAEDVFFTTPQHEGPAIGAVLAGNAVHDRQATAGLIAGAVNYLRAQLAAQEPAVRDVLLTTKELALRWKMSPDTIRAQRTDGSSHPPFIKIGARPHSPVRYRLSDVIAFEHRRASDQEAAQ